jgi:hypothetical protein
MGDIKQRKNRDFLAFETVGDVINILRSQFTNRKLYVKYSVEKLEAVINEYIADNTLMIVTDPDCNPGEELIIYGLSDKYIEVDLDILEVRGPGYFHCKIKSARRAVKGRKDLRFKLAPDDVVATNFRLSKQTIDISGYNIPTSIKVVLDQFQSSHTKLADIMKVSVFESSDRNALLNEIKKTSKSLFIPDVSNQESYHAYNDEFIDCFDLFGDDIYPLIKNHVAKGYQSILIVPIIYITEDANSIPFAYIQLISRTKQFTIDDVLEVKKISFQLVERIRDANTIRISVHQQIIDISRGGGRLFISDEKLKTYILKSRGFIFDIVFKLQAPITIYGEVKVSYTDKDGNLYVGVDFEGNSSRKDEMKRFFSILKPMEVDYKSRLLKNMRDKKRR